MGDTMNGPYAVVIRRGDTYVVYEKDEWETIGARPGANPVNVPTFSDEWPIEIATFVGLVDALEYAASRQPTGQPFARHDD